jgi:hypothetical protein
MSDIVSLLTPVPPSEIPDRAHGQRARTSQPVLDAFVDSGQVSACIKTDSLEGETAEDRVKRAKSLLSSLSLYATNHQYPVQVFSRGGSDVYLKRRDLNDEGETIAWTPPEPKPRKVRAEANGDAGVTEDEASENDSEYAAAEYE